MKKIFSLFLGLVLIFAGVISPEKAFALNDDFGAETVVTGLGFMELYNTGNFEGKNYVSRAEFSDIALKLAAIEKESGKAEYADVSEDTPFYDSIYTATKYGILKGDGNGRFEPNEFITLPQAAKICLSLLGYDQRIEDKGGYPLGCYAMGTESGILSGLKGISSGEPINRSGIARLIYNTLRAEVIEIKTYNSDGSYKFEKGMTMLEAYHEIKFGEGIVEGNERTHIKKSGSGAAKGCVLINGKEYSSGKTKAFDLLGLNAEFYYKKNEKDINELLLICQKNNDTLSIEAEDIIKEDTGLKKISYYDLNGNKKSVNLSADAGIIYNGIYYFGCNDAEMVPLCGDIKTIDANGDGKAETVIINNYKLCFVSHVNKSQSTVILKSGESPLQLSDYEYLEVEYKDGKESSNAEEAAQMIKPNDVLLVAESLGSKEFIRILGSSDVVRERILKTNQNEEFITQKYTYKINPYAGGIKNKINPGEEYNLYLDAKGYIADIDLTGKDYAYLIKASRSKKGIDKHISLKLYTTNGIFENLECAEKVEISDESGTARYDSEAAYAKFLDDAGNFKSQLIVYELNGEGKINRVELAKRRIGDSNADGFALNYEDADASKGYDDLLIGSDSVVPGAGNAVYSLRNAVMFTVPDNTDSSAVENVNMYKYSKNTGELELGFGYDLKAFDADENNNIAVVLRTTIMSSPNFANDEYQLLVIENIGKTLDSDKNFVNFVEGYRGGKKVSYMVTDEQAEEISKLEKGDALFVSVRSDNFIGNYKVAVKDKKAQDVLESYYSSDSGNGAIAAKTFANTVFIGFQYYVMSGTAEKTAANGANMYDVYINAKALSNIKDIASADISRRFILDSSDSAVVYYDADSNRMWLGNYDEIEPGDKICIAGFRKYYVSCVVYK